MNMKKFIASVLAVLMVLCNCNLVFAANTQDLTAAADALNIEQFVTKSPVTSDLVLPLTGSNDTEITWYSHNEDVLLPVGSEGLIFPQKERQTVKLTATFSKGNETVTKDFNIEVGGRTASDTDVQYLNTFESVSDFSTDNTSLPYWSTPCTGTGSVSRISDPDTSRSGNNVLKIDNSAGSSTAKAEIYFDAVAPSTEGQKIIVEEEIYNSGGNSHLLYLYGGTNNGSVISNSYIYASRLIVQKNASDLVDAENPYTTNKWYKIRYELDPSTGKFDYYLNDKFCTNGTFRMSSPNVSKLYMGRSEAGYAGTLYIDNVKVYRDPYFDIEKIVDEVEIPNANDVKGNLDLPSAKSGVSIRWISGNTDIITNAGVVSRPESGEGDKEITLTAILEKGGYKISKKFDVTVKEKSQNQTTDDLEAGAAELIFSNIAQQDADDVKTDFTLPLQTENGCSVSWESNDMSALIIDGNKAIVIRGRIDTQVELKAIISKDGTQVEKTFNLTIAKIPAYNGEYHYIEDFSGGTYDEEKLIPTYGEEGTQSVVSNGEGGYMLHISRVNGAEEPSNNFADMYFDSIEGKVIVESRVKHNGGSANFLYSYGDGALFTNFTFGPTIMMSTLSGSEKLMENVPANTWYTFQVIMDFPRGLFDLYINDELIAKDKRSRMAGKLLNHILSGLSLTSAGNFYMDYVRVYADPFYAAQTAVDSIDIGRVDALEKNITLPTLSANGYEIEWISSNPDVISHDGVVVRPASDTANANVTLAAIVRNGDYVVSRTFEATVLRHKTDEESVDTDMASLYIPNPQKVMNDLNLYTTGEHGTTISWSSNNVAVDGLTGKVTRPDFNDGNLEPVELTATVTKGNVTKTRTFNILVVEMNYALEKMPTGSSDNAAGVYRYATDGSVETSWLPATIDTDPNLVVDLGGVKTVNLVTVKVSGGTVFGSVDNRKWEKLGSGSVVRFSPKQLRYIKVEDTSSVAEVGVYMQMSDEAAVEVDLQEINLGDLTKVTSNITLPESGANGSIFTWTSSDTTHITNGGAVTRPSSQNCRLNLTVVARKGDAKAERTFSVIVLASSSSGGGGGGGSYERGPEKETSSSVYPPISSGILSGPTIGNSGGYLNTNPIFKDLASASWAEEYICYLADRGIVNGVDGDNFEPQRVITRNEFIKIIINALNLLDNDAELPFSDIDAESWACPYVASAYKLGIVNGITSDYFGGNEPITRQDMAVIASKAMKNAGITGAESLEKLPFVDNSKIADYAIDGVSILYNNGILSGYPDGSFNPTEKTTRAQSAKIVYCILKMMEGVER